MDTGSIYIMKVKKHQVRKQDVFYCIAVLAIRFGYPNLKPNHPTQSPRRWKKD